MASNGTAANDVTSANPWAEWVGREAYNRAIDQGMSRAIARHVEHDAISFYTQSGAKAVDAIPAALVRYRRHKNTVPENVKKHFKKDYGPKPLQGDIDEVF